MRALHAVFLAVGVLVATATLSTVALTESTTEASIDRVGVWQTQTNVTDFEDSTDVRTAIDDGSLARATGVDQNDTLVIEMRMRGFADTVLNANGSNTTERFLSAMTEHGDLVVQQTNPGPSQRPLHVRVLDGTGVRVFSDVTNDTYYVAADLDTVRVTRGETDEEDDLTHGPYPFLVEAELAADSPLTKDRQLAVAMVESRSATVETAPDDRVYVRPLSNLTVTGTTNVGPGWPVTLVLSGDDDPETSVDESFQSTKEAVVERPEEGGWSYEGRFVATFDRDAIPTGARDVTLDVRLDGSSLLDHPIPVTVDDRRASVSVSHRNDDDQFTGVSLGVNATLSTGGFLVLHEESADGPVVGHTAYLDSGNHVVTVYTSEPTDSRKLVVVAHRDANHNEWFDGPDVDEAYSEDEPDDAIVLSSTESPTSTETTAVTPRTATTGSPTTASTGPSSAEGTTASPTDSTPADTTLPGFGAIAAVVALLVVLGVLERR